MYPNPLQAYQTIEKNTVSPRETEARVLTEAALKLKYCQDNWDADDRKDKLDEALEYNQRVWSILQGELLDENNPLPKSIRENLLNLSAFIDKRIFNVMAFPKPEKLAIVININLNLAAGLRGIPNGTSQSDTSAHTIRAI